MTCAKSRASGRFYRVRLPDVQLLVPQHLTLQCSEGDATQLKEGIRDRGQNYKEACERFKRCGRVRYPSKPCSQLFATSKNTAKREEVNIYENSTDGRQG